MSHANREPLIADPQLPSMRWALDPVYMRSMLEHTLSQRRDRAVDITGVTAALLRHKPGRRCLIRYELTLREGNASTRLALIGKMRSRGLDKHTFRLLESLRAGGFGANGGDGVYVAEPVTLLAELDMYLLRAVAAAPLGAQLDRNDAPEAFRNAGRALWKLHANGPLARRVHTSHDEMRILTNALTAAAAELPQYAARIERVLVACADLVSGLCTYETRRLHRDFYPDQVLAEQGSIWLLDLDLYANGDPAVDLGNFVAHLQEFSLRRFGHCHGYAHLERAFLAGYRDASGRAPGLSVQTYVTLTLARHIAISRRVPGRKRTTDALISQCERRLAFGTDGGGGGPRHPVVDPASGARIC